MKSTNFLSLLLIAAISSCSKSDDAIPAPTNEQELITTIKVKLKNGTNPDIVFEAKDLDGDGPNPTVFTPQTVQLAANTSYTGEVEFKNESVSPSIDITPEIITEGIDHQIFYQKSGSVSSVGYPASQPSNLDANGKPIGVKFTMGTSPTVGLGTFKVILKHKPNKDAAGAITGDPTSAGGNTDAQATFNILVQ